MKRRQMAYVPDQAARFGPQLLIASARATWSKVAAGFAEPRIVLARIGFEGYSRRADRFGRQPLERIHPEATDLERALEVAERAGVFSGCRRMELPAGG